MVVVPAGFATYFRSSFLGLSLRLPLLADVTTSDHFTISRLSLTIARTRSQVGNNYRSVSTFTNTCSAMQPVVLHRHSLIYNANQAQLNNYSRLAAMASSLRHSRLPFALNVVFLSSISSTISLIP